MIGVISVVVSADICCVLYTAVVPRAGFPALTATATVSVVVMDVNDNAPRFNHANYNARIIENRLPGDVVAQPWASDLDTGRNADIRYGSIASQS